MKPVGLQVARFKGLSSALIGPGLPAVTSAAAPSSVTRHSPPVINNTILGKSSRSCASPDRRLRQRPSDAGYSARIDIYASRNSPSVAVYILGILRVNPYRTAEPINYANDGGQRTIADGKSVLGS